MTTVYRPGSIHDKAFNDECTVQIVSVTYTAAAMPRPVMSGHVSSAQVTPATCPSACLQRMSLEVYPAQSNFFAVYARIKVGQHQRQTGFCMNHESSLQVDLGTPFFLCRCGNPMSPSGMR